MKDSTALMAEFKVQGIRTGPNTYQVQMVIHQGQVVAKTSDIDGYSKKYEELFQAVKELVERLEM